MPHTLIAFIMHIDRDSSLFYGRNSGGTHVFTAVTKDNADILSFDEDFYPLFKYILEQARKNIDNPDDLPKDPWLGIVGFGTETWLSNGNVTFTASDFSMYLKGNATSSDRNSTGGGGGGGGNSGDNRGDQGKGNGGGNNDGDDSTSSGDEEDDARRLMSRSVLGYVVAAALVISAILS